jgi:hypothetical protein
MFKALFHKIGTAVANYLMQEVESSPALTLNDFAALEQVLRPGDVILIEGGSRISGPIKYLTQSTWSHAALFVGPVENQREPDGEPHVLVEAELIDGVRSSPLSRYRGAHTRICRPVGLAPKEVSTLVSFACERLGEQYDLHNLFDLVRYLLPTPPIPARLRRRAIAIGAAAPTRAICSTLIAQAFQSIHYPILPIVELTEDAEASRLIHPHVVREILHVRNSALYVPRDFDISPYFAVVKPTIAMGFDFHEFDWTRDPPPPVPDLAE